MAEPGAPSYPFRDLPEGTVTFLFSDIEGSTQLLYRLGDRFTAVVGEHHRILRAAIGQAGGHVVRTEGDSFFVAFPRATDAVAAAVAAQRELAAYPWPEGAAIRVRMGLHTGEAEVALDDYVGIAVHRAARIAHAGCGGQVLLSETTAALTGDELPVGVTLLDLGRHLLKDIRRPERIAQLRIAGLPAEFPPLKTQGVLPPEGTRLPRPVGACPYRGLAAFREADAPFYCGREAFVGLLEGAVRRQALTAVIVGSSGSGKSSALFAGLLPRLRAEGGWQFALLRPGSQPFYALAGALLPLLEAGLSETDRLVEIRKLAERLAKDEVSLAQVIERIHEKASAASQLGGSPSLRAESGVVSAGRSEAISALDRDCFVAQDAPRNDHPAISALTPGRILLVVDQFEELYTLCSDAKVQTAFIDELLAMAVASKERRPALGVILVTLRADFMGQALAHRPFADALQEGAVLMGPMTRAELRTAIEKPAELQGAAFEAGLVERILDDVGEKPGNLPLLEFTLTLLWERQTDGWLTHVYYEAMGSVEGALAAYADQVYAELALEEQERARHALVQLVRPGEGTEDTRRVTTRAELGEENWRLIQHLADRRLVVTGRDAAGHETAEVVHEALIGRWGRFRGWMDADRAFRAWQERLRGSLQQWQESKQDDGALLAGAPLAAAETWLAERAGDLSAAEAGYIEASGALQARQQRERQRRRQVTVLGLSAGLLLALILAGLALLQRQNALHQAAVLLAGQAETELANGYQDRAVLLALTALENYPYTAQAERALGRAVSYDQALQQYASHTSAVTSLDWSPDGSKIASSSTDNTVRVWNPATGKTLQVIALPTGITGNAFDWALTVKWTPDGQRLVTLSGDRFLLGSQDYDLILWDAATGKQIRAIELPNSAEPEQGKGQVTTFGIHYPVGAAIDFAQRSGRVATLGGDNTAIVWDAAVQTQELILTGHRNDVNGIDWSPKETHLATASEDGTARIWDARTGREVLALAGHTAAVNVVAWSPDGARLATGSDDLTIRIWDAQTGDALNTIEPKAGIVWSLAWSPDGKSLAIGTDDGRVRLWDIASSEPVVALSGHSSFITHVAWSPDGGRFVSAANDGTARVWKATPGTIMALPYRFVATLDWSSDSRFLALPIGDIFSSPSTEAGRLAIWDVRTGRIVELATEFEYFGSEANYSPDDRLLLVRGVSSWPEGFVNADPTYVVNAATGKTVLKLNATDGKAIRDGNWSPDGARLATASIEGAIDIWEFPTGKLLRSMRHGQNVFINQVAWSPDGAKLVTAGGGKESMARIWDAASGRELLALVGHEPPTEVASVDWSPDGKYILTTSGSVDLGAPDNTARIWDAKTGKVRLVIHGHTSAISSGDWSPDGARIATISTDDTLRVWDATSGAEVLSLAAPTTYFAEVRWSPDGKYIAVGLDGSPAMVFRVWQSKKELIAYARECCVIRELTPAERKQFGLP